MSVLVDFEKAENENPSARNVYDDRIVYASRRFRLPKSYGHPVLCDFGEARRGNVENNDDIQPEVYRAPEVILEMNWSYSVDIWNVGVMVRQCLTHGPILHNVMAAALSRVPQLMAYCERSIGASYHLPSSHPSRL